MLRWISTNTSPEDPRAKPLIEWIERFAPQALALVVVYVAVDRLAAAASRPFWNDEVITSVMARQPSVSTLWNALAQGADGQPPLYYLVERLFAGLISNQHIALRLPSIIAFCCTLVCMFLLVKRRSGSGHGLICAVVLLNTVLFDFYAVEARPYSLAVAAIAFALLCYQRAAALSWSLLLCLSLALAVSLHYYAVFALAAFVLAEAVYCLVTRRCRARVWLAIACACLPMIAFWPLLSEEKKMYGAHTWAHPKLFLTLSTYGSLFHVSTSVGLGFAVVLALSLIAMGRRTEMLERRAEVLRDTLLHEQALVLGLLFMPLVAFVVTRLTHGALLDRYLLWVALAMTAILGYVLPTLRPESVLAVVVFLFIAVAAQGTPALYSLRGHIGRVVSPASSVEELVSSAGFSDLPVVVSSNNDYVQLSYYSSAEWARRFVAIVDPPNAFAYVGTDTSDKELPVLAPYGPFRVYEFSVFIAAHPAFLMYSTSDGATAGPFGSYDWWVPRLVRDGYSLRVVAAQGNRRVYLVSPGAGAHEGNDRAGVN